MSIPQKSVAVILATLVGAAVVIACGDDDSTGTTDTTDAGATSSSGGSSTSSSGGSSSSSSGATSSSSGDSGTPTDGGNGDAATNQPIGATCQGDGNCASGACFIGGSGGGGGSAEGVCTLKCTMAGQNDAVCKDAALTGKCNNKGFCQPK